MLRSMQEDNPQKEVTVHIKWRKLARHAITTVDGEPAQLPSPTPQPEPTPPPERQPTTVGITATPYNILPDGVDPPSIPAKRSPEVSGPLAFRPGLCRRSRRCTRSSSRVTKSSEPSGRPVASAARRRASATSSGSVSMRVVMLPRRSRSDATVARLSSRPSRCARRLDQRSAKRSR